MMEAFVRLRREYAGLQFLYVWEIGFGSEFKSDKEAALTKGDSRAVRLFSLISACSRRSYPFSSSAGTKG